MIQTYNSTTEELFTAWIHLAFPRLAADSDDCLLSISESEKKLKAFVSVDALY